MKKTLQFCAAIFALTLVANTSRAASLTYQVTHNWSTNPATFVGTVSLSAIPPFNPALGTLTNVIYSLVGERRTEWEAAAPFQFGTYSIGAQVQFNLKTSNISNYPEINLSTFTTPNVNTNGFLSQGQTVSGTLISAGSGSGVVTNLGYFTQTNQLLLLSVLGLDGGAVGTGGGGTFNYVIRYVSATVTITYEYTPVIPPTLSIASSTPGNATISWTPNTPGYILQQTALLSPANWTNSPSGATNPIVVPISSPAGFYRLFKP